MKDIKLAAKDIYNGNLILVNSHNPINSWNSNQLIPVNMRYPDILMELRAASMLDNLIQEICGEEEDIIPISGYRSKEIQEDIYKKSLIENGSEFTRKYVALPNHSEHQTGLAIDLTINQDEADLIRPEFPYTGKCGLFRKRAATYGFIERYEEGKEKITGIGHEPWHFRYVGYPHSQIMVDYGLSLEEYIPLLKTYPYQKAHFLYEDKKQKMELFFIESNGREQVIEIMEDCLHQVSGNNQDGFIVTLWRKLS